MAEISLTVPDARTIHEDSEWVKDECLRSYVEQRRQNCTYMDLMDLWSRAPWCMDCIQQDAFRWQAQPDVRPSTWEVDFMFVLGLTNLGRVKEQLKRDSNFALVCRNCSRELRPWEDDELVVIEDHLEEYYSIRMETPGQRRASQRFRNRIFRLYDYNCFRCGSFGPGLHIDHVRPQSKGGDAAFRNLQALCTPCGRLKGDAVPNEVTVYRDMYFEGYPPDSYEGLFW